jgi:hypothetical protein
MTTALNSKLTTLSLRGGTAGSDAAIPKSIPGRGFLHAKISDVISGLEIKGYVIQNGAKRSEESIFNGIKY